MQIDNHVFIVTRASSGIGLATATALTDQRAKVALLARSAEALSQLSARLPVSLAITVDRTDFDGVRRAIHAIL